MSCQTRAGVSVEFVAGQEQLFGAGHQLITLVAYLGPGTDL